DKPFPPAEMYAKFAEQKLDAQKYELDVEFKPAENRITVKGTLVLVNRGAEKMEMLMMLGAGLKLGKLTVNGKAAEVGHSQETLTIKLAEALKKDGTATLAFDYTGQYAAPAADEVSF